MKHSQRVLCQREDHCQGDCQEEVCPKGQQLVLRSQRVERVEVEGASLVQQRWRLQQAVEKSLMLKVLSEKW